MVCAKSGVRICSIQAAKRSTSETALIRSSKLITCAAAAIDGVPFEEEGGVVRDTSWLPSPLWSTNASTCLLNPFNIFIIKAKILELMSFKNTSLCRQVRISRTKTLLRLNAQAPAVIASLPLYEFSNFIISSVGIDNFIFSLPSFSFVKVERYMSSKTSDAKP